MQHSSPEVKHPPRQTRQERTHGFHGTADEHPAFSKRHPLVATAMVLPLAALLVVVFGGWDAVVTQASSVAVMLGR